MMNPINEMRRLNCKSYDELMQIATIKYDFSPNGKNISKVELITCIIALAAARGDMDIIAPKENKNDDNRTCFILENSDGIYHVRLTKEQIDFAEWCFDKNIDFNCLCFERIKEFNWETP